MRRLVILRKDLNMKTGKLLAMVGHCFEAYWTNQLKSVTTRNVTQFWTKETPETKDLIVNNNVKLLIDIPKDIWDGYVNGSFTKTICAAKNLNHLKKVEKKAKDLRMVEGKDYGYINDKCLTELTPENPDGTCTVGIWFKPLPDDVAHVLSKGYRLYGIDEQKEENNEA